MSPVCGIFSKSFLNLRPLLSITFPQGFRISKYFGHPTSGSGGKIGLKIYYMKRGHIYTYMDIATTRKNRPKGRFFEKENIVQNKSYVDIDPNHNLVYLRQVKRDGHALSLAGPPTHGDVQSDLPVFVLLVDGSPGVGLVGHLVYHLSEHALQIL